MVSTEEKKTTCELGELATKQQNVHRQQFSLQQHLKFSLVKERRQKDLLKYVLEIMQNQQDVNQQVRGETNEVMKTLSLLKADMTNEKTMRLRLQKLAMANQISLKKLQKAHRKMQNNMTRTVKRLQTKVQQKVQTSSVKIVKNKDGWRIRRNMPTQRIRRVKPGSCCRRGENGKFLRG